MHIALTSLLALFHLFFSVSTLTVRAPDFDTSSCHTSTNSNGDTTLDCPGGCQQVTNKAGWIKLQQGSGDCSKYFGPQSIVAYADGAVIQAPDCHITVSGGQSQEQGSSCSKIRPIPLDLGPSDSTSTQGAAPSTKEAVPSTTQGNAPSSTQEQQTSSTTTVNEDGAFAIARANITKDGNAFARANATAIDTNATAIAIATSEDGNITAYAIATAHISQCVCPNQADNDSPKGVSPAPLPQSNAKRSAGHMKRDVFYEDDDDPTCSSCQTLHYEYGGLMLTCPDCKLNVGKDLKLKSALGQCSKYTSCLVRSSMALAASGDHNGRDSRCTQTVLPDGRSFRVCPGCTSGMNKEGKIVGLVGDKCNEYSTSASLAGSADLPLWEMWPNVEVSRVGPMTCTQIYWGNEQTVVACPGCTKIVDWDGKRSVKTGPSCSLYWGLEVKETLLAQEGDWWART